MDQIKRTPATPLQGDPVDLEMFKLQGHTRLTDCVIARVATEIPEATPADMAIALRNHAYSLEHDRAKLVEALIELAACESAYQEQPTEGAAYHLDRAMQSARVLLRSLGEDA